MTLSAPLRFSLLAVLLVTASPGSVLAADDARTTSAPSPSVSVVRATSARIAETVVFSGTIVARDEILIAPEIEGLRLIELLADEGDEVKAGQVLARIDSQTTEIQLAQSAASLLRAQANLTDARAIFERTKTLNANGNAPQANLDTREAALKAAEADYATAAAQRRDLELRLSRTQIKAPRDGFISRRTAKIGQLASGAGEPLFRLVADGEIELEAEILETRLTLIKAGQPASVIGQDGAAHPGTVRLVASEVDRVSRLGKVRIALGKNRALKVGAFGRGQIDTASATGIVLPIGAVAISEAGAKVQIVVDGKVEARDVKTGLRSLTNVEIKEGLSEGDLVVLRAGSFLRSGDTVRTVLADTATKTR